MYTVYICPHLTDGTLFLQGRCTSCLLGGACLDIADRRNGLWSFMICAWKLSPQSSIENSTTLDNQATFLSKADWLSSVVQAIHENTLFSNGFGVFQGHMWTWEHAKTMEGCAFQNSHQHLKKVSSTFLFLVPKSKLGTN